MRLVVVEEQSGAQLLPPAKDQHGKKNFTWVAHLAMNADLRIQHQEFRDIAKQLLIKDLDGEQDG